MKQQWFFNGEVSNKREVIAFVISLYSDGSHESDLACKDFIGLVEHTDRTKQATQFQIGENHFAYGLSPLDEAKLEVFEILCSKPLWSIGGAWVLILLMTNLFTSI